MVNIRALCHISKPQIISKKKNCCVYINKYHKYDNTFLNCHGHLYHFISPPMKMPEKGGHPSDQACSFLPISWFLGGNLKHHMALGCNYSLLCDISLALHGPATVQQPR